METLLHFDTHFRKMIEVSNLTGLGYQFDLTNPHREDSVVMRISSTCADANVLYTLCPPYMGPVQHAGHVAELPPLEPEETVIRTLKLKVSTLLSVSPRRTNCDRTVPFSFEIAALRYPEAWGEPTHHARLLLDPDETVTKRGTIRVPAGVPLDFMIRYWFS